MDAGNYCSICDRYFSSAYNRKRHVLRKHMDHDDQSNGSDTETVDYSKPVPDCCKLEKSPTLVEATEDDNMSTTSSHDSHESSSSMMYPMKKIHPMKKWMKKEIKSTKKST